MQTPVLSDALTFETLREIDAVSQQGVPVEEWRVSSMSSFGDDVWEIDGSAASYFRRVLFASPLPLGQPPLTDPGYEGLLLDCKLLIWAALKSNTARGAGPKTRMHSLRLLFAWMMREGLPDFSHVTRERVWSDGCTDNPHTFSAFLLEHRGGDPEEISKRSVEGYFAIFSFVFRESGILKALGRAALPEHPFDTNEFGHVVDLIGRKETEEWRPVPDEVLVPLLNASDDWIGQRADGILTALEVFEKEKRRHVSRGVSQEFSATLARKELVEYLLSLEGDETWHEELRCLLSAEGGHGRADLAEEFNRLVRLVQAAAIIAIQQCSGMRSGEMIEISSEQAEDGTPVCLEERKVAQGMKTLVILHSVTSKINDGWPEAHEWIVGVKPNLPFKEAPDVRAQRAVNILIRLGNILKTPNTPQEVADLLLVNWQTRSLPATGSILIPFNNWTHNQAIRLFLSHTCGEELAKLPDDSPKLVSDGWLAEWRDSRGAILHSHQLRKSFANFAYSMEPGLKEEIRNQYGHMSQAMTGRYTNDPHQLMQVNEMEAAMAAEHIVAALSESALAGKGADELVRRGEWLELRERFEMAEPADRHEVVTKWLLETGRLVDEKYGYTGNEGRERRKVSRSAVSNAAHGLCAAISIRGDDMECRKDGGSTSSLLDGLGADRRYRTPSRCLGCMNYVILPCHRPYWEDRFRRAEETVSFMRSQGHPLSMYEIQLSTANQSRAWLKSIGVTDSVLNKISEECRVEAEKRIASGKEFT